MKITVHIWKLFLKPFLDLKRFLKVIYGLFVRFLQLFYLAQKIKNRNFCLADFFQSKFLSSNDFCSHIFIFLTDTAYSMFNFLYNHLFLMISNQDFCIFARFRLNLLSKYFYPVCSTPIHTLKMTLNKSYNSNSSCFKCSLKFKQN
jgi:hypothetical protein